MPDILNLPVISLIGAFAPGMIYVMAEKHQIIEGFRLCAAGAVNDLDLDAEGGNLFVEIRTGSFREVRFSAADDQLEIACECGGKSPRRLCRHAVAALVALKKLTNPGSFPMVDCPAKQLETLTRKFVPMLSAPPPSVSAQKPASPVSLRDVPVFAPGRYSDNRPALELRLTPTPEARLMRGDTPATFWNSESDSMAREFLVRMRNRPLREQIATYLHLFGAAHPIRLILDTTRETVFATTDSNYSSHLLLDSRDGRVSISLSLDGKAPLNQGQLLFDTILIDLDTHQLHLLKDTVALSCWKRLSGNIAELEELLGDGVFERDGSHVVLDRFFFNSLKFCLDAEEAERLLPFCRFRNNGAESGIPDRIHPAYRLNIVSGPEHDGQSVILAEGIADAVDFTLSTTGFSLFDAAVREHYPVYIRAKKRQALVFDTCFALARDDTGKTKAIIRAALNGADLAKRNQRAEMRQVLDRFLSFIETRELLLVQGAGGWRLVEYDKRRQAHLFEILYRQLGGQIFDSSSAGEIALDAHLVASSLPALISATGEAGFGLVIEDKPIAPATLHVTVDATTSGIDWFEIRPEIRLNGELLNDDELRSILGRDGIFSHGSTTYLVDETSRDILALILPHKKAARRKKSVEVVRIPRLQILDWIHLRNHGVELLLSPEDERIIAGLTNFETIPVRPGPAGLKSPLRHYQQDGYHWLAFLYEHGLGACLADDMGLGKTIQSIALLGALREGLIPTRAAAGLPHLVVVPPSLLFNWESELERFYPELRVRLYTGQGRVADFDGYDVIITSYGILQRDIGILKELRFHVVIFDEAQVIKNLKAVTTGAARQLQGVFTVNLTGTPVENHLGEFYSIIDLCVPGLLGPYDEFSRRTNIRGITGLDILIRRTRPFVLRRTKQMIVSELPPKIESDIYLELTPRQRALYQRTVEEARKAVNEAYRSKNPGQARIIALTVILKLRQICLSPALLARDLREVSPKLDFLVEQVQELRDEGHSALVFSQFVSYLDIVEKELIRHGIPYLRLDGSTPTPRRKTLVNAFQKSDEPLLFLISLKAGGRGLNLTRATYVYHLDPWWNPAVENQASDRAHRIGQTRQVTITRLLMRHTVEEKMMELKHRKLKLYKALLEDGTAGSGAGLSKEDFDYLLG